MRKPTILVSEQVSQKLDWTVIEAGKKLEILYISRKGIVQSMMRKQRR